MSQRKKSGISYLVLGILLFSGVMVYLVFNGETENAVVNLVLKKDKKVYLYSKMGEFIVRNSIDKNQTPTTMPFVHLYQDDGKIFIDPNSPNLNDVVNLLCGEFQVHPFEEQSSDGYVTSKLNTCLTNSIENQSTQNIGEQLRINTIQLEGPKNKMMDIKWETNTKTFESKALKNCYKKTFNYKTQVHPGEFVISPKDFIVVDLEELVAFYGNKASFELDNENQLLYISYP